MLTGSELVRPMTLEEGGRYLLSQEQENENEQAFIPVRFAAYDNCPAFVIVFTERGEKLRCPRDLLFTNFPSLRL